MTLTQPQLPQAVSMADKHVAGQWWAPGRPQEWAVCGHGPVQPGIHEPARTGPLGLGALPYLGSGAPTAKPGLGGRS